MIHVQWPEIWFEIQITIIHHTQNVNYIFKSINFLFSEWGIGEYAAFLKMQYKTLYKISDLPESFQLGVWSKCIQICSP